MQLAPTSAARPGERLFKQFQDRGQLQGGQLPWASFAPLCQQIGWDQDSAQNLWFQTDTDKSGLLSKEEFIQFAARPDVSPYFSPLEEKMCSSAANLPGKADMAYAPSSGTYPVAGTAAVASATVAMAGVSIGSHQQHHAAGKWKVKQGLKMHAKVGGKIVERPEASTMTITILEAKGLPAMDVSLFKKGFVCDFWSLH